MSNRMTAPLLTLSLSAMLGAFPTTGHAQTPVACIPLSTGSGCLEVAPDSARVDLKQPVFSDPTTITNPLFPISDLHSVVFLGHVDGKLFRTETTLLPETRVIEWNGLKVECLTSQYVAYLDGRIQEVALDWYAQSDDGAVWYFGEDVSDFEDGIVVTNEGTWLAGRDGPAAMIMPANPQIGDAFRTETIPGVAFEEVTISATDLTLHGPNGPVAGAIIGTELHQDGTTEEKVFAPGYGEFRTGGGGDLEAMALAVPTDALDEPLPAELQVLATGSADLASTIKSADLDAATATAEAMTSAWDAYSEGGAPAAIAAELNGSLVELVGAVDARAAEVTRQEAINAGQSIVDLQLRYLPPTDINRARLGLWAQQVLVDAEAKEAGAVMSDIVALELIRDRVTHDLDAATAESVDTILADLHAAAEAEDFSAASDAAGELLDLLAADQQVG